jgi:ABC-2 type transport system permease protein
VTGMRTTGAAAAAIVRRDVEIFMSYPFSFVTPLVSALFGVTLFHYIAQLVHAPTVGAPDDYFAYVVVGIVILGVLTSAVGTPPAVLRQELVAGTFERLVLSPFGAVRAAVCMMGFPLVRAVVIGVATLAFADIAFGLDLRWPNSLLAIPVGALAAVAFAPFGLAVSASVILFKRATIVSTLVISAMSLLAGAYFPVSLLPAWIRWTSDVQPFTPATELMRHLMVGTAMSGSAWLDILKLAAFAAVLLPAAGLALTGAVQMGRRRGTLIEY